MSVDAIIERLERDGYAVESVMRRSDGADGMAAVRAGATAAVAWCPSPDEAGYAAAVEALARTVGVEIDA